MSLALLFFYLMLNMFQMLIHPSSSIQSVYAIHILQNKHEYSQMNSTMTLPKPLNDPNVLLPYEQYYIQSLHQEGKLIPEQSPGDTNPLFQTVINPQTPHST